VIVMPRPGAYARCCALAGLVVLAACATDSQNSAHFNVFHIGFEADSFAIGPAGEQVIRDVASLAEANKAAAITIVGRTDSAGSTAYNARLAQKRATAVHDALIATGEVGPERIETAWTTVKPESATAAVNLTGPDSRVVDILVR